MCDQYRERVFRFLHILTGNYYLRGWYYTLDRHVINSTSATELRSTFHADLTCRSTKILIDKKSVNIKGCHIDNRTVIANCVGGKIIIRVL